MIGLGSNENKNMKTFHKGVQKIYGINCLLLLE